MRRPAAHVRLLEQYRTGERFNRRFPRVLCDALLADEPVRRGFQALQADERRHADLYSGRIVALGETARDVPPERDYMSVAARSLAQAGLGIPYDRLAEDRPLDHGETARLFALYVLAQERGLDELDLHRAVSVRSDGPTVDILDRIAGDERRHHLFTLGTLAQAWGSARARPAATAGELRAFLAPYRAIETRAYHAVTARFLTALLTPGLLDLGAAGRLLVRLMAWTCDSRGREIHGAHRAPMDARESGWPLDPPGTASDTMPAASPVPAVER